MSDDLNWATVEEIFHEALERPSAERLSFIRQRCAGDAGLFKEVSEILAGFEEQEKLSSVPSRTPFAEGTRYGVFEIVRKIGEGGMGAVYLARRHEDFEQRAAIKLISGTPAAVALLAERFRQERQILAQLEHPNIARLLDGGVSADGQPYLVMEYVEGVRVDEYCRSHHFSIRQRLDLFRKICAAVDFAHKHLVIHRDLKPGNILVNEGGEPKLLDFGIAKVLTPSDDAAETVTMTGALILTPQYASPEQIQGRPCTVASDVYSLGVILCELLAGKGPYTTAAHTPAELIAAVVTQEAARPSSIAPADLKPALRGDLDGIVLKALAKKPGDRYGSAEQLSDDIGRHLDGLPVTAVEGTRMYVARKFIGRHRIGVAAVGLILLSLIGGLAATLWQARAAERQRALAEQRFSDARKLGTYLLFPLYDSVQSLPRSLPVRVEMASQSLEYLDHLAATRGTDPAFNKELAEGYLRLGGILQSPYGYGDSLGNSGKALESDRKAVELLEALAKVKPSDPAIQLDLARAYLNLGPALNLNGKPDEAVASVQRATAMFDRLAASRPEDLAIQVEAGRAWAAAMDVLSSKGGGISDASTKDRVLAAGNQAIAHLEAALARSPADADALSGLASAYKVLATIYYGTADFQQAIAVCEKSLDALQRMPPAARETPENQGFKAQLESLIGQSDGQMGKYAAALAILKPAQQVLDRLAAEDPRNATPAYRRMNLYRARSNVNENAGHLGDAIADGRVAVQILDQLIEIDPAKTSYRVVRAEVQQKMAKQLADSGQMAEAKRYGEAGVAYLDEVAERPDASAQSLIEAAYARMEPPIPSLADYPRAIRYAQRADQLTSGKNPVAVFYLAQAYENALDGPKALAALQRFGALLPPTPPGQKPSRFRSISEKHLRQIQYLIKTGRLPKSGME